MSAVIYTARIGYADPDVVDITRKTGDQFSRAFAPSWALLGPVLQARRTGGDMEREWRRYVVGFGGEMLASRENAPGAWRSLLARPRAVLVCYCSDPERCHRTLLARDILPKLGAVYGGELAKTAAQGALF